jgi:hypothetical protein
MLSWMVSQPPKSSYATDLADDLFNTVTNGANRPSLGRVNPKPSSVCKSPPRITILANPTRARTRSTPPAQVTHPSCICQASLPRITILVNPARTRSLPSIQNAPLPSTRHAPSPPRITILTNPARKRLQLPTENLRNTQNAATPASQRSPTPISILKAFVPDPSHRVVAAATPAPSKRVCPTPSSVSTTSESAADSSKGDGKLEANPLPKIVVHEPGSWDVWADGHEPGTSHGQMLDVPAVNGRSKLHEDDFARFYPREYTADRILRRLRSMVRGGNRQAAASRRERARQRRQAAAGATTVTPTPTSIPTSTEDPPIIARTAGDTEERESPFPTTPETYKDSNPSTPVIPLLPV